MQAPNSILVVITRRIGDVLLATPLIRSLKNAWPQAKIDVLVFKGTEAILEHNPDIHQVLTVSAQASFSSQWTLLKSIFRQYDIAISTLSGDRPTFYAWLAGKYSIGVVQNVRNDLWKPWVLNKTVLFNETSMHTVSMYLELAKSLDIPVSTDVILDWTHKNEHIVNEFFDTQQPFAVLHVYPKYAYKMWHTQGWKTLASWLSSQGIKVVLTGSTDVHELAYVNQLLTELPSNTINLCGKLSLTDISYLLSKASVYVGPDTSITHMAAAIGIPTIALFGPTNTVKWGPWPKGQSAVNSPYQMQGSQTVHHVRLVQGDAPSYRGQCVPCFKEGCDKHIDSQSDCIQNISAQTVIESIKKFM